MKKKWVKIAVIIIISFCGILAGLISLRSVIAKKNKKDVTQTINLVWTIDIDVNDKGIVVHNLQPYDEKPEDGKPGNAESWIKSVPVVEDIVNVLVDEFTITPSENNLFNAATGMYLNGKNKLLISGSNNVKM